jgi:hypothetical protein
MPAVYTNEATDNSRKRPRTAGDRSERGGRGDRAGGGGGTDDKQLRAHGYEVKSDDIVDDSRILFESLDKVSVTFSAFLFSTLTLDPQLPDHLRIVYRPLNPKEEFVAKRVRKRSNELDIFRYLDTIERKSDHVIAMIDSFDGWAVLPKLVTVMDRARTAPKAG